MNEERFQTSSAAIYREVGEELVVIQVDTGCFYYFNKTTKRFLDFFRDAATVTEFLDRVDAASGDTEYLEEFCRSLVSKRILEPARGAGAPRAAAVAPEYSRPTFLREGEKRLDEIASEIAVLTTFTG
jgi:hypothetical protein